MNEDIYKLCESVGISPHKTGETRPDNIQQGRSTDGRHMLGDLDIVKDPLEDNLDLSPEGWEISFVSQSYDEANHSMSGPVPIHLSGHTKLSPKKWEHIIKEMYKNIHGDSHETIFMDDDFSYDVRDYIYPGRYHRPFFTMFPEGHDKLHKVVNFVDNIYTHPMATSTLKKLEKSDALTLDKVDEVFDLIKRHLSEPTSRTKSTGDILDVNSEIRMNLN